MSSLVVIYVLIAISGVFIYFFNLHELSAKKKLIGTIHSKWSSRFNLAIKINWVYWVFVFVYLSWSLFPIITEPYRENDYTAILIFILFLSFYPRWNIVIGSKGIISGMEVLLWEDLIEWKVTESGKLKYLELKWASYSDLLKIKTRRIRLPENKKLILPLDHKEQGKNNPLFNS